MYVKGDWYYNGGIANKDWYYNGEIANNSESEKFKIW